MAGGRTGRGRPRARAGAELRGGARVTEHRLRNGLQLLLAERHADPVVAVMLYYRVGSRDEPERLAGVSHLVEHMMFKGTRRFGKGEVDRITTELGGQNNAFTGTDHTGYWFELASDRWERALEIEADRMRGLLLDPAELDAERDVVLEELAMGEDDPWRVLTRRVEAAVFPRHGYGRPIIGFEDTLRALTADDVRGYYEEHYHPDNAILVVCGDIQPRRALARVREHFGGLPRSAPRPAPGWRPPLGGPEGQHRLAMHWDDSALRLAMAWPTAAVGTDEDYVLDVLGAVLTSGRGSRLYRSLVVERSLALSVSSHNDTRVEGGVFWLVVEGAPGAAPDELESAVDAELERLRTSAVRPAELKRARALLVSSDAYESEAVSDVAERLGEFAADGDWRMALDGCRRQLRVTAKELRDVAARLLTDERRVVGWCTPRGDSA